MPNDICKIKIGEFTKHLIDNAKGNLTYTEFLSHLVDEKDMEYCN
jgi:hypothetical protein